MIELSSFRYLYCPILHFVVQHIPGISVLNLNQQKILKLAMNSPLQTAFGSRIYIKLLQFVMVASILFPCVIFAQSYSVKILTDDLEKEQKEQLLNVLSVYRQRNSPYLTPDYIERLYLKGASELEKALQVFGYYKATITSTVNKEQESWAIEYTIIAGPAIKVRDLNIVITGSGRNDEAIRNWYKSFPIASGDTLNQQKYEQAKSSIRQVLQDYGYLDGQLTAHELRVSLINNSVDVVLHIHTGERYRFGDISFIQETFALSYLNGFLPFASGDYYQTSLLTELQKLLSQSGEFQKIEVTPQVDQTENQQIPVRVLLIPRKPRRYSIGIGYGTDTGARTRLGFQRRQITDTGHRADFDVFYSQIKTEFTANYYIPLKKPASDYFNINATRTIEDTDDLYRQTNSTSLSTVYALKTWERTLKLTYLDENYRIGQENDTSQLLIPSIGFRYIPTNLGKLDILQWRMNIEVKGADEAVLSDTTFVQNRFTLSSRLPLIPKVALLSRADVGWSNIKDFKLLPVSQRFFAGGDNSIRGYAYNSLGPEDANGDVVGGSHLLVGSVELQYAFKPNWDIATFIDAGNAFNEGHYETLKGAGFGFGYALPIGSLRVYAANALDKDGTPWRLHITVGAQW